MGKVISFTNMSSFKGDKNMLKKETMIKIENKVEELLQGINFKKSPYVDIVSLVKKDGFKVEVENMDIDTTGCLFVNDDDEDSKTRLIVVNSIFKNPDNEPDVIFKKSRFITAHEYGHFILHKEKGHPIFAHRDTYNRTDPQELEADYFARSILMPLVSFKPYYKVAKQITDNDEEFSIALLSKVYKVTRNKVRKRVEDLLILNQ